MPRKITEAHWYDYPLYYDISLQEDNQREANFIEAACRKYCPFPVRRLLEPACGTGRLVTELAGRGYEVVGFDLSRPSLDFLAKRLKRKKLTAELFEGDMSDFRLQKPVDAAFNPVNSFRLLMTEQAAQSHLRCVCDALRPGGIYILGLHLMPPDADEESTERWGGQQGKIRVTTTLRVLSCDRRRREERLRASILVRHGEKILRLRDEFSFRLYNLAQMRRTLRSEPRFELCGVYDFWYEIDEPQKLDSRISDTVLILRRKVG